MLCLRNDGWTYTSIRFVAGNGRFPQGLCQDTTLSSCQISCTLTRRTMSCSLLSRVCSARRRMRGRTSLRESIHPRVCAGTFWMKVRGWVCRGRRGERTRSGGVRWRWVGEGCRGRSWGCGKACVGGGRGGGHCRLATAEKHSLFHPPLSPKLTVRAPRYTGGSM